MRVRGERRSGETSVDEIMKKIVEEGEKYVIRKKANEVVGAATKDSSSSQIRKRERQGIEMGRSSSAEENVTPDA